MAYTHVIVLHTDNGSFHKTKYIIDLILALRHSGYKVYFLTTTRSIKYINDVPIKTVIDWLPRTIFGYFRSQLIILRSVILATYVCLFPPKGKPSYVICDGSSAIIPILKYFGFRVAFVNYMVSFHRLITKMSDVRLSLLSMKLLKKADDVIVPSNQCKVMLEILNCKNVTVLMPPFEQNLYAFSTYTSLPLQNLNGVPYIFSVFGEYDDNSMFHLVLDAYRELKVMLPSDLFNDTRVILVGKCENPKEKSYWDKIEKILSNEDPFFSRKVFMYDLSDIRGVKTFLKKSLALIDVTENTLFNIIIMRAQTMGIPVICFHADGFHNEIVQHEETGVFIPKKVVAIRNSMHRLVCRKLWARQLSVNAKRHFRNMFSTSVFKMMTNQLVSNRNVKKYNPFVPFALRSGVSSVTLSSSSCISSDMNI